MTATITQDDPAQSGIGAPEPVWRGTRDWADVHGCSATLIGGKTVVQCRVPCAPVVGGEGLEPPTSSV